MPHVRPARVGLGIRFARSELTSRSLCALRHWRTGSCVTQAPISVRGLDRRVADLQQSQTPICYSTPRAVCSVHVSVSPHYRLCAAFMHAYSCKDAAGLASMMPQNARRSSISAFSLMNPSLDASQTAANARAILCGQRCSRSAQSLVHHHAYFSDRVLACWNFMGLARCGVATTKQTSYNCEILE